MNTNSFAESFANSKDIVTEQLPFDTLILGGNSTNAILVLGALERVFESSKNSSLNSSNLCRTRIFDNYVGTSSGSIICLLLSIGYTPLEIVTFICVEKCYSKMESFNVNNLLFNGKGLISFEPIAEAVREMILDKISTIPSMEELKRITGCNLVCVAYDITNDRRIYISAETFPDMSALDAIRASSAFPFVFEPFYHEKSETYFVDGGLVDNLALNFAVSQWPHSKCLCVYIENKQQKYVRETNSEFFNKLVNNFAFLYKLFQVFLNQNTVDKVDAFSDENIYFIKLSCESNFFNFNVNVISMLEMFDDGYEQSTRCDRLFIES